KTDPWDHVESAMALNLAGYEPQARLAFQWLAGKQLEDGSWYSSYRQDQPEDRTRDTNQSSYIAVGVFHDYLLHQDLAFLRQMWPVVEAALEFALRYQAPGGEIYWALSPEGRLDHMALLTGSSSVFMSIKCGLAIARRLRIEKPAWREAFIRLKEAISLRPHSFNMTKSRYAMDWFYPILTGAVTGAQAHRRVLKHWSKFVVQSHGVLCVSDQPWVTIAETAELVIALSALGNYTLARIVFCWILDRVFEDSTYWAGYTYRDMVIWPEDKITWTNAGVLLAADALEELTPASRLFSHAFWEAEASATV
ncbi:MAG: phenyltransferase domain-containing protein, partial [Deltaproteobacteria bacterium]|nr:phenyltransferase domain-containing protein [Deltaproteobacteria bacterium]